MKKKDTKTPQDIHLVPQFLVCSKQKYRQSKLFITKIYHLTIKRRLFIIFHYYFNKKIDNLYENQGTKKPQNTHLVPISEQLQSF